ncbi:helix-turn-helix domain-containing protein [Lysinibacillus telephonicus]|uniref:XRE family transcriptional regulator n=1 Tax=Lysinibacillus telephonicus TaxID=1714840 RepID=A0A431UPA3_9BACI|nr:helix-turn-helix transcriptional regulator [Lysinibacillus telephonicus]RTQ91913.1 XRE family transcriptional regulator [Lysinibacillus telephonicus]
MSTMGERIRKLRKLHGLSQDKLAELIEKTKSNVSGYENDKFEPSAQTIIALCKVFNISADSLLFGADEVVLKIEQSEYISIIKDEIELVKKIKKLNYDERLKIEGIIDGILISKELSQNKNKNSSLLINGEESATTETA